MGLGVGMGGLGLEMCRFRVEIGRFRGGDW